MPESLTQTITVDRLMIGVEANRNLDPSDIDGANQLTPNNAEYYPTLALFFFNGTTGNWDFDGSGEPLDAENWLMVGLESITVRVQRDDDADGGYGGFHFTPGMSNTEIDTLQPGVTASGSYSGGTPGATYTKSDTEFITLGVDLTGYDPDTELITDYISEPDALSSADGVQTATFTYSPAFEDPAGLGSITFTTEFYTWGNRTAIFPGPVQLPLLRITEIEVAFTRTPVFDDGPHLGLVTP